MDSVTWMIVPSGCHPPVDRSGQFDQAMAFQVAIDKCRIVALQATPDILRLAQTLGYAMATEFEFLGVSCTLQGEMSLLKFHALRAAYRLRLLKWAAPSIVTRRKMILSLVIPSFTWAAGWALPTSSEMTTLRQEILKAFTDLWGQQPATVLAFERIGWKCEPNFAGDLALLRVAWRSHAKTPQWLELSPIAQAFPSVGKMLPLLGPLLQKLGWSLQLDGAVFTRIDDAGRQRSLRAGFGHFRYLADWLLQCYRKTYVGKCGRVQKRYHREGQGLARRALTCRLPTPLTVFFSKDIAVLSRKPKEGHSDRRRWAREHRLGSSTPAAISKPSMSAGSAFAGNRIHRRRTLLGCASQCQTSEAIFACLPTVQRKDCRPLQLLNFHRQL